MLIDDDARGITLERPGGYRFRFPGVIESYQETARAATVRYRLDDDPHIAVWRFEAPFRVSVLFLFTVADAELDRSGRTLHVASGRVRFGKRVKTVIAWDDIFVVALDPSIRAGREARSIVAVDRSGRERWRISGPAGARMRGYGDIGWRGNELLASYGGIRLGFGAIDPATGVILNRLEAR